MLERLFSSHIRVKLLTLLLLNPGQSFHIRQLTRRLDASYSNVRRELQNLTELGLLKRKTVANAVHFSANESHLLYRDLRSILLKTEGLGDVLYEHLAPMDTIRLALVYGSTARGTERADSDIDVLIVGALDRVELENALDDVEARVGRPVNYVLYTPAEWESKLAARDPFVTRVMAGEHIIVFGNGYEHSRIGTAGTD
ncbi:MAG: nucleotidyltransferase domain-containing protein [Chloroflexi bacterium]|nr:nucleotidyltransferase domain-containing protein [Chloroflexota bacterium]MBU1750760.1 nucleotidyltransferase domain-containing protein [Chloroflexota bacterium]MBU1878084.1 nucleotidyltransferase domain-containing protein [Chloroflexota bacterium]